jgi:hypothetical protein
MGLFKPDRGFQKQRYVYANVASGRQFPVMKFVMNFENSVSRGALVVTVLITYPIFF